MDEPRKTKWDKIQIVIKDDFYTWYPHLKKENDMKNSSKFKPFQKVLIREGHYWTCDFFSHTDDQAYWYYCTSGKYVTLSDIIPYEGHESYVATDMDLPLDEFQKHISTH